MEFTITSTINIEAKNLKEAELMVYGGKDENGNCWDEQQKNTAYDLAHNAEIEKAN